MELKHQRSTKSKPMLTTLAQGHRLAVVRNAAEQLGESRRYFTSDTRLHVGLPDAEALSSDDEQDVLRRRASFVICVPGYVLESIVVEVQFPATLADVLPVLQAMRRPERASRFPHLVPVAPQPTDGTGVFVAAPRWNAHALTIAGCSLPSRQTMLTELRS